MPYPDGANLAAPGGPEEKSPPYRVLRFLALTQEALTTHREISGLLDRMDGLDVAAVMDCCDCDALRRARDLLRQAEAELKESIWEGEG